MQNNPLEPIPEVEDESAVVEAADPQIEETDVESQQQEAALARKWQSWVG